MNTAPSCIFPENRLFHVLGWLAVGAFCIFFLVISWYNRPASDDWVFLAALKEKGWFLAVAEFDYNIRWGSFLFFNTVFWGAEDLESITLRLFLFQILLLLTSVFAIRSLFKSILERTTSTLFRSADIWLASLLITAALFHLTIQYSEIWFWAIASCVYLLPTISFLAALGLILSASSSIWKYPVIFLLMLLAAGGLETWTIIVFSILSLLLFIALRKRQHPLTHGVAPKIITGMAAICCMGIITLTSSNLGNRSNLEERHKINVGILNDQAYHTDTEAQGAWKALTQPHNLIGILFLLPFLYCGQTVSLGKEQRIMRVLAGVFLMLCLVGLAAVIPVYMVFGNLGPERTWSPISTVGTFTLLFLILRIGKKVPSSRNTTFVGILSLLLGVSGIVFYASRLIPMAQMHAQAYDDRVAHLREHCNGESITLQPLPDPGILISGELSKLHYHAYNESFQYLLNLNCSISVPSSQK